MRSLLSAAFLLVSAGVAADRVELVERQLLGRTLDVRLSHESEAELVRLETLVDGVAVEGAGEPERRVERRRRVEWRDRTTGVEEGDLQALERTYGVVEEEAAMLLVDPAGGRHERTDRRVAPAIGEALLFRLGDEGWQVELAPAKTGDGGGEVEDPEPAAGRPAWLDGLDPTPGWGRLLPEGPLESGATWDLPVELLAELRAPGGDLAWELVDGADDAGNEVTGPPDSVLYAGELSARLDAVEGDRARIELVAEVTLTQDLTPWLPTPGEHEGGGHGHPPTAASLVIESTLAGRGLATWDLEAGRLVDLRLDLEGSEVETTNFGHQNLAAGPASHDVELVMRVTSSLAERLRVTVEPGS